MRPDADYRTWTLGLGMRNSCYSLEFQCYSRRARHCILLYRYLPTIVCGCTINRQQSFGRCNFAPNGNATLSSLIISDSFSDVGFAQHSLKLRQQKQ